MILFFGLWEFKMEGLTALIGLDFNIHEIFLQSCSIVRDSPNLSLSIAVFLTGWVRLSFHLLTP
ncbi:hypothetical protein N203_07810 [Helicobacter pylori UM084]|nr:hypothetical protein N203_07810 [Helicobacter pylori UM084]